MIDTHERYRFLQAQLDEKLTPEEEARIREYHRTGVWTKSMQKIIEKLQNSRTVTNKTGGRTITVAVE